MPVATIPTPEQPDPVVVSAPGSKALLGRAALPVSQRHSLAAESMMRGRQDVAEHFYELFTHPVRNLLCLPPEQHIAHDRAMPSSRMF